MHDGAEDGPQLRLLLEHLSQVAHQAQREQLMAGHVRVHHVQLGAAQLERLLRLEPLQQLVTALTDSGESSSEIGLTDGDSSDSTGGGGRGQKKEAALHLLELEIARGDRESL